MEHITITGNFLQFKSDDYFLDSSGKGQIKATLTGKSESFDDFLQIAFKTEYNHDLAISAIYKNYPELVSKTAVMLMRTREVFVKASKWEIIKITDCEYDHTKDLYIIDCIVHPSPKK